MTVTHAQHMAHLDAEQRASDVAGERTCSCWHPDCGAPEPAQPDLHCPVHGDRVPFEPPDDPDLDETYPPDPERTAA